MISAWINGEKNSPAAEQSYTLTCSISGAGNLSPKITVTYQWTRNNETLTQVGTNSNTHFLPFLRLSDAGQYACQVTLTLHKNDDINIASKPFEIQIQGTSACSSASSILLFTMSH